MPPKMNLFLVFMLSAIGSISCDPCEDDQSTLLADNRRSSQFVPGNLDVLICDQDHIQTDSWYRFTDELGNPQTLVEGCVEVNHCGTFAPIWLDGSHPESNTIVTAQVCATYSTCAQNGCDGPENIQIKRCTDGTYRYQLVTPAACIMAYCAGNQPACNNGMIFDNVTSTCIPKTPELTGRPRILPPRTNEDETEFWIECVIPYSPDGDERTAHFEAFFLFNGIRDEMTNKTTDGSNPSVKLFSTELDGHLGSNVKCDVSAWWENGFNRLDPVQSENGYYIGIQVYEEINGTLQNIIPPIEISERDGLERIHKLYPVSTLPITCPANFFGRCLIELKVVTNVTAQLVCKASIEKGNWQEDVNIAYNPDSPFLLQAAKDYTWNENQTYAIHFKPFDNLLPRLIWHGYKVNDVQVKYSDGTTWQKLCSSVTDPHVTTFDGLYYHSFEVGTFNYIVSETARKYTVQVRHVPCGSIATCNCAVVVREWNTILGVDICESYLHPGANFVPNLIQYSDIRENGTAIYRDMTGKKFAICMISGACVRISIDYWGLSLSFDGIPEDEGKIKGLCGNYNQNPNDDDMSPSDEEVPCAYNHICPDFSNAWRVPPEEDLFEIIPDYVEVPVSVTNGTLCQCLDFATATLQCGANGKQGDSDIPIDDLVQLGQGQGQGQGQGRRKRSTGNGRYEFNPEPTDTTEITWPTPSGKTEQEANETCRNAIINSPAYPTCHQLFGDLVFEPVVSCVEDIKISDNVEASTEPIIQTMEELCINKVYAIQRTEQNQGTEDDPVNIIIDVQQKVCPSQCSNQGQCLNGTCFCNTGFIGVDCSVRENEPPLLKSMKDNGTCDARERPCTKIYLTVDNIVDSEQLTCRLMHIQYSTNGQQLNGSTVDVKGSMRSKWQMMCPLPETPVSLNTSFSEPGASTYGFMISISNDGNLFSPPLELTVYDSVCQICESAGNCIRQLDSCVIAGHCVEAQETNPTDWCQQCRPHLDTDAWSISQHNRDPVFTSEEVLYKLENLDLSVQLKGNDPDYPDDATKVQFSLESPTAEVSISSSGLLNWSSNANTNVSINIRLTDNCGSSQVQQISLVVIECPCQNSGTCIPAPGSQPGSGEFQCQCVQGTSGDLCETDTINSCAPNPCGHGSCVDLPTGYTCDCGAGLFATDCGTTTTEGPDTTTTGSPTTTTTTTVPTTATTTAPTTTTTTTTTPTTTTTTTAPTTTTTTTAPTTTTTTTPTTTTTTTAPATTTTTTASTTTTTTDPTTTTAPPTTTTTAPTTTTTAPTTTATTTSAITQPNPIEWSTWSQWSECSRTCDYGLRTRERQCSGGNGECQGTGTETEQCTLAACTEEENEQNEGVTLTLEETVQNFLSNKLIPMKRILADIINEACSTDQSKCCEMAGLPSRNAREEDYQITGDEFVYMRRLYPETSETVKLKMVVLISQASAQQSCATNTRKKRSTDTVYVGQDFLINVVHGNSQFIEQSLNIRIVAIEEPEPDEGPKDKSKAVIIAGCASAGVVLLLVVIIALVVGKLKLPTKVDGRTYPAPSANQYWTLDNTSEHNKTSSLSKRSTRMQYGQHEKLYYRPPVYAPSMNRFSKTNGAFLRSTNGYNY